MWQSFTALTSSPAGAAYTWDMQHSAPLHACTDMVLPCCAALITLFTPFEYLSDATSISTLFSFFLVAASLLWRR